MGGLDLLDAVTGRRRWKVATDRAGVRGGPVAVPQGVYALSLDDGRMVVAGPKRWPEFLKPAGRSGQWCRDRSERLPGLHHA